jgi:TIR domain.
MLFIFNLKKEAITEPLIISLIEKGAKAWYDKFTLRVGDSLRKSIDDGLANSKYEIVILSGPYFKKFWTGEELNGLFAKQKDGRKVILPLRHNTSKDVVKKNSQCLRIC